MALATKQKFNQLFKWKFLNGIFKILDFYISY